jgi:hypothetical protein
VRSLEVELAVSSDESDAAALLVALCAPREPLAEWLESLEVPVEVP